MGYDLHITRRTEWSDDEQESIDISLEEWFAYIDIDNELELSDNYWVKVPGSDTESHVSPGYCEWTKHPSDARPGFDYSHGCISTKNPDDETIRKMLAISKALNAHLQGDDGEIYRLSDTNKILTSTPDIATSDKKPWWQFW